MELIAPALMIALIILLANTLAIKRDPRQLKMFDTSMTVTSLLPLVVGLAFLLLPADKLGLGGAADLLDTKNAGAIALGIALWGLAVSLPAFRRLLARWLPLDPVSPVHTMALALSGLLAASTLFALSQGGLQQMASTTSAAGLMDLFIQFLIFVLLASFGVGFLTRRNLPEMIERLGLKKVTRHQLLVAGRWIAVLVLLQWAVSAVGFMLMPEQSEMLDQISGALMGDFDTIGEWLLLAFFTGAGEELLFRGALQPILGLKFTAALFAISHVQYGVTPVTIAVFLIGMALGYIRRQHSTSVAILVHAGYNLALGIVALLAASVIS